MKSSSKKAASPLQSSRVVAGAGSGSRRQGSAKTLNEAVYGRIKELILQNRLKPGQKLGVENLAQQLGVSRTPIREALERLHQERWTERVPGRGFFVVELEDSLARDLYEAREALELFALQHAFEKGIETASLAAVYAAQKAYADYGTQEPVLHRGELDRNFHVALARLSGNEYIAGLVSDIIERLLYKRRINGYNPSRRQAEAEGEHELIIRAIELGDRRLATERLREHILSAHSAFDEHLRALAD